MNQRIKELAKQSGFRSFVTVTDGNDKDIATPIGMSLERFAELLLEDVLSICEDLGDRGMDGHYCVDAIAKKYSMNQWRVEE